MAHFQALTAFCCRGYLAYRPHPLQLVGELSTVTQCAIDHAV